MADTVDDSFEQLEKALDEFNIAMETAMQGVTEELATVKSQVGFGITPSDITPKTAEIQEIEDVTLLLEQLENAESEIMNLSFPSDLCNETDLPEEEPDIQTEDVITPETSVATETEPEITEPVKPTASFVKSNWCLTKSHSSSANHGKRKSLMGAKSRANTDNTPQAPKILGTRPIKRGTWSIKESKASGRVPEKLIQERKTKSLKSEEKRLELSLTILSAENLPKCDIHSPYVVGFFDAKLSFRTRTKFNAIAPIWNEKFEIDMPSEPADLHFTLWNHYSARREDFFGAGFFHFNKNVPSDDTVCIEINSLSSSEVSCVNECNAKLHIKYSIHEIDTQGESVVQLLINNPKLAVQMYYIMEEKRIEIAAFALVELFHSCGQGCSFLSEIIGDPKSRNALLTKNSILRKMIGVFCKYCRDSYVNVLQPVLLEMEDNNIQLEVRPSYISKQYDCTEKQIKKIQRENKTKLMNYTKQIIHDINETAVDLNTDLRKICKQISDILGNENPEILREILGDIIFQKYLCPIIASPLAFGLTITKNQTQSNIVLAKIIVQMAMNQRFPKSNELSVMNGFIKENSGVFNSIYQTACAENTAFMAVLASKQEREKFRIHLAQSFCAENLEFYEDVQNYKALKTDEDRKIFANTIYTLYIGLNAERQINIDSHIVQKIKQNIETGSLELFDAAVTQALYLLRTDSFHKYKQTRRKTIVTGQQISRKVRTNCLNETCNFLLRNRGVLKQSVHPDDKDLLSKMNELDDSLNSISTQYNPHRDVSILNRTQKWQQIPRAAWKVSESLLTSIIELYKAYFHSSGSFTDESIAELISSNYFENFANETAELQLVKVHHLSNNQKLSFWINIYNTLALHAYICIGQPNSKDAWTNFQAISCYEIDGKVYSLLEIEHCVLRGGMGFGKWLGNISPTAIKPFDSMDERYNSIYTKPCPYLNFFLCNGINTQPLLHVFSPGSLQKDFEMISQYYLQETVSLNLIALKEVHVPETFNWICKDMGTNKRKGLTKLVSQWHSTVPQKQHILSAMKSQFKIVIQPSTWEFLPMFE